MKIEIDTNKLLDIIESSLWGRMSFDDIREALEEIKDQLLNEAWEVVE